MLETIKKVAKLSLKGEISVLLKNYNFDKLLFTNEFSVDTNENPGTVRTEEPFVFIDVPAKRLGIAELDEEKYVKALASLSFTDKNVLTLLEKTILYYQKRLAWYDSARDIRLVKKYGALGIRRQKTPTVGMESKIKAEPIPEPVVFKNIEKLTPIHAYPFSKEGLLSYDNLDLEAIKDTVGEDDRNLVYKNRSEVPEQNKPDLINVFINKELIEKIGECSLNFKSGWYPLKNEAITLKDFIEKLDKKGSKSIKWDNFLSESDIGIDCEFIALNSKLLTFQIYNLTYGVGFIYHYKKGQPRLTSLLARLKNFFDFKKVNLIAHYNIAEISHLHHFTEELALLISKQKELLGQRTQKLKEKLSSEEFYEYLTKKAKNTIKTGKANGRDEVYRRNACGDYFRSNGNSVISTKPLTCIISETLDKKERLYQEFELVVKDSYLTINKESLKKAGDSIGFNKDDLSEDEIKNMDTLLLNDPIKYYRYGLKDSIITAIAACRTEEFLQTKGIVKDARCLITSASTIAGKYAVERMDEYGMDIGLKNFHKYSQGYLPYSRELLKNKNFAAKLANDLPSAKNSAKYWQDNKTRYRAERTDWFLPSYIEEGKEAYYGGRNECYAHGKIEGENIDIDLKSAYPSAMMALYTPDWHNYQRWSGNQADIAQKIDSLPLNAIGYIRIAHYKIKEDVLYPNLPAKLKNALIFVREQEGGTFDLISFLYCYKNDMFEELTISQITYFPPMTDFKNSTKNLNLYGDMVRDLILQRTVEKDPIGNKTLKNVANFIYGKTCQGIGNSSTFSLTMFMNEDKNAHRGNQNFNQPTPPSAIYNPVYAAAVTGFIRTLATEEMEILHRKGIECLSVTTDGFVALCNEDEFKKHEFDLGMFGKFVNEARLKNIPCETDEEKSIFTIKHISKKEDDYYSIATRFYYNVSMRDDDDVQLAGAGIQLPRGKKSDQGKFLLNAYLNPINPVVMKHLASIRDIFKRDKIFNSTLSEVSKNYDYDRKRMPIDPKTTIVRDEFGNEIKKVSFFTKPFASVEEYMKYRKIYANYRATMKGNKIQTQENVAEFTLLANANPNCVLNKMNIADKTIENVIRRMAAYHLYTNVRANGTFKLLKQAAGYITKKGEVLESDEKTFVSKNKKTALISRIMEKESKSKSYKKTKLFWRFISDKKYYRFRQEDLSRLEKDFKSVRDFLNYIRHLDKKLIHMPGYEKILPKLVSDTAIPIN